MKPHARSGPDASAIVAGASLVPTNNESIAMKVGESAQRARARKVSKKMRFEEAFERIKAELRALTPAPVPIPVRAQQRTSDRPILRLPVRRES
jgi:hypothetical protein